MTEPKKIAEPPKEATYGPLRTGEPQMGVTPLSSTASPGFSYKIDDTEKQINKLASPIGLFTKFANALLSQTERMESQKIDTPAIEYYRKGFSDVVFILNNSVNGTKVPLYYDEIFKQNN